MEIAMTIYTIHTNSPAALMPSCRASPMSTPNTPQTRPRSSTSHASRRRPGSVGAKRL